MSSASGLDRINVADKVGDSYIRRSQLFHVAVIGREVSDRSLILVDGNQFAAPPADWGIRIVVDLASGHIRKMSIEQRGQRPQNAALGLSTKAK